jgi:hypothetical protein
LIYCLHENKLWAYDIALKTERELALPANIPAGANLAFLTDLYNTPGSTFNYFVLGTQEGNDYTLYLYTILGGQPDELVYTFKGEGRVEKLRYAGNVTTLDVMPFMTGYPYPFY